MTEDGAGGETFVVRAGALVATRRAMLYAFLLAVIALSIRACVQH
jgi:hypothetical protein